MIVVGVAKCPLCEVICYCTGSNGTEIRVLLYRIAGCPLLRDFECIEVYGDTVRTLILEMSVISQVSAIEGCPLSGVPL